MYPAGSLTHPPLQSIAERRTGSGEESEEDEEDEEGGWHAETREQELARGSHDETVLKTGYLWKKGERRKVRGGSGCPACSVPFDDLDFLRKVSKPGCIQKDARAWWRARRYLASVV